jgi:hypothetical protein
VSLGTIVDIHDILMLKTTSGATRDEALQFREVLRRQLRLFEDMHGLPHSFQTKTDIDGHVRLNRLDRDGKR